MTTQNNNGQANNNLPEKKPLTKLEVMNSFFEKDTVRAQLANALQDNASSFIASVIDLYTGDDKLMDFHPEMVAMQALKAAVLKLPIIKSLGYAYIVPFKGVPTFMLGYKGMIQLALRTNQYKNINADVVFNGEFKSSNKLTGEFDLSGTKKSDEIVGYFSYFETKEGFSKTLFMSKERVIAHAKKYSKSYGNKNSPWETEFDAMAIKTVLRGLLSHWGIMSIEMQSALTDDDRDIAEKTMDEIKQKGNKSEMGMNTSSIEEVHDENVSNNNAKPAFPF